MMNEQLYRSRRMSFLGLIAWVSVCLIVAGWYPQLSSNFGGLWVCVGLFGLASAVGLSECVKTEIKSHQQLLDSYISEARTDALTGVANRRAFDLELKRVCDELPRRSGAVSLLLIDVDHFKRFNDTHGHQAGDEMLRAVGRLLRKELDHEGLVTRYGGEEFAVILPGKQLAGAILAAELLRAAVERHEFAYRGTKLGIQVSVGVVAGESGAEPDDLVVRGDTALYAAKEAGRNCVFYHDGVAPLPVSDSPAAASV